ncbi:hypothetical protein ACHQM5_016568 [Ranunculus cassubicifolius]
MAKHSFNYFLLVILVITCIGLMIRPRTIAAEMCSSVLFKSDLCDDNKCLTLCQRKYKSQYGGACMYDWNGVRCVCGHPC